MPTEVDTRLSLCWAPLDIPAADLDQLTSVVSREERHRADRLRRPLDRERFLAARGQLRLLLAEQLSCSPSEVPIVIGEGGKPRLEGSDLRFNASRSSGTALYAISWEMDVGVDIEAVRQTTDILDVGARFFTPAEQADLAALPPSQRLRASFQCWACKEAYVKGIGAGLTLPISTLDVFASNRQHMRVSGWTVHHVDVVGEFVAAVAGTGLDGWSPSAPRKVEEGNGS
jgi:4'-phosphopantetheinyl transferase